MVLSGPSSSSSPFNRNNDVAQSMTNEPMRYIIIIGSLHSTLDSDSMHVIADPRTTFMIHALHFELYAAGMSASGCVCVCVMTILRTFNETAAKPAVLMRHHNWPARTPLRPTHRKALRLLGCAR